MEKPINNTPALKQRRQQALVQGIIQKQEQRQLLAPQLRQTLELLQLPVAALQTKLSQMVEQSPFLTYDLPTNTLSFDALHEATPQDEDQFDDPHTLNANREGYGDQADFIDQQEAQRRYDFRLASLTAEPTLFQHLEAQLESLSPPPSITSEHLTFICGQLDERGYLRIPKEELLVAWANLHHGIASLSEKQLETAIKTVQTLDPVGVGARSLQECLLLQTQADIRHLPNRALYLRLCHNLAHVEHDTPAQLCKHLHCTPDDLHDAFRYLRTLDPAPGRHFAPPEPLWTPDILAQRDSAGQWRAYTYEAALPTLRFDNETLRTIEQHPLNSDTKHYLSIAKSEATQLLSALEARNTMLQRIAQAIFDQQQAFLNSGCDIAQLRPLQQRTIAETLNFHPSTLSRAVKDKMVKVEGKRAPIPLALFFTHAIPTQNDAPGETVSDHHIRARIKDLIEHESPAHPLSDEAIATQLQKEGFALARRTVAKYRTQLNIPSTRDRRLRA